MDAAPKSPVETTAAALGQEQVLSVQPTRDSLVWQQNRLAEARYKLSPREQKLLLYVISMIEPEAHEFGKCKIGVQGYADVTGLRPDDLYQELRDTALSIREKTLVVEGVLEPGMQRPVKRHGSWFEYVDEATGDGYVTIKLSSWLRPFLLQVRREFFKYKLKYALNLKSEYSIRLYQWLKRWQYAGRRMETIAQLRLQLGATEVDHEGRITRENLAAYKHFKNKALTPALAEINAKTDLRVSSKEEKVKGSKAVGAITFSIRLNQANQASLDVIHIPDRPQLELSLDIPEEPPGEPAPKADSGSGPRGKPRKPAGAKPGQPAAAAADGELEAWAEEFGLSPNQRDLLRVYIREQGKDYVVGKAEIVRSEPRDNAARAFLAALKQDWKAPRRLGTKPPARRPSKPAQDEPAGWREYLARKYPEAQLPDTYRELRKRYPSIDQEIRAELAAADRTRPAGGQASPRDAERS